MKFLEDHAIWTEKVLNLEEIQSFLSVIAEREGISSESLPEIMVMVLPYPRNGIDSPIAHGSYLPRRNQIRIYPGLASWEELEGSTDPNVRSFSEVVARSGAQFAQRHVLTVIHELLHVKYGHDENLVDEMSEGYLEEFLAGLKCQQTRSASDREPVSGAAPADPEVP
jgi:hypothetical protein